MWAPEVSPVQDQVPVLQMGRLLGQRYYLAGQAFLLLLDLNWCPLGYEPKTVPADCQGLSCIATDTVTVLEPDELSSSVTVS